MANNHKEIVAKLRWKGKLLNSINNILTNNSIGYRANNNKTPIANRERITTKQANAIISQAEDLISNPDFRPYFFKTLYLIGPNNFTEALEKARAAEDPKCRPCLFVHKLKEYRDQVAKENNEKNT